MNGESKEFDLASFMRDIVETIRESIRKSLHASDEETILLMHVAASRLSSLATCTIHRSVVREMPGTDKALGIADTLQHLVSQITDDRDARRRLLVLLANCLWEKRVGFKDLAFRIETKATWRAAQSQWKREALAVTHQSPHQAEFELMLISA